MAILLAVAQPQFIVLQITARDQLAAVRFLKRSLSRQILQGLIAVSDNPGGHSDYQICISAAAFASPALLNRYVMDWRVKTSRA